MFGEVVAGLFLITVVYLLVKPGSKGTTFVSAFGDAMSAIISQATDWANPAADDTGTSTNGN